MRIYFICKPQRLTRKIKAHSRRDSARGSKTLRGFYCFCHIQLVKVELIYLSLTKLAINFEKCPILWKLYCLLHLFLVL